jgi:phosphopantothenate---cysteine ligase (CTP)
MQCIVTAGPTFEPLDEVRRLTNFSTGRLGSELANFLTSRGHGTTLLLGQQATYRGDQQASRVLTFSTTADLRAQLQALAGPAVQAVFHAAAVSDFGFGKIWQELPTGERVELSSGKFSTRQGKLLAELVPTPKIIAELRPWYPTARLVGWKYEVVGDRASVVSSAQRQLVECQTDACVANGPAYGRGFGLVTSSGAPTHWSKLRDLFGALEGFVDR